jgi:hypothetical protein
MKLINEYKVKETKEGNTYYVLQQKQGSFNSILWITFCEREGKEVKGTRSVLKRLNKELKEYFEIN